MQIVYPVTKPQIREEANREMVFCINRKRWVLLTPEEWVRQNFLLYLVEVMHYPLKLIAVEKQLLLGDVKKRFDLVVYKNDKPFVVVECKEMKVPLTRETLDQVMRYNINLQAEYFVITNGTSCVGFRKADRDFRELDVLPLYEG